MHNLPLELWPLVFRVLSFCKQSMRYKDSTNPLHIVWIGTHIIIINSDLQQSGEETV